MPRLLLALFLTGAATAAPVPKELKKEDDPTKLRGTWVVTKCNVGGVEKVVADTAMQSIIFDGKDGMRTKYKGTTDSEWAVVLDPDASPKRMSWRGKDGKKGNEYECTYAFTKDDRLIISIGHQGSGVPASVEPGPKATVREFKRADAK